MRTSTVLSLLSASFAIAATTPDYIYGVNLGSWLLYEPWMAIEEWKSMGGEECDDCSSCASSEFDLTKKLGQSRANQVFKRHWQSWFNQTDVDTLVDLKINAVRIPMGFWILEGLVDRDNEYYAEGALAELKRGLRMLKAANISVLLDMHAMPGVAASYSQFAGRCTGDVQFYTSHNYDRALRWTAVMTALIHLDPDFQTVYALQAVNEPLSDSSKTPGLQRFYNNFVKTVRSVELALGIACPTLGDMSIALNLDLPSVANATASASSTAFYRRQASPSASLDASLEKRPKSRFLPDVSLQLAYPLPSATETASAQPTALPTAGPGVNLPEVIYAQSQLDDAIDVKAMQTLMADTLVAVGIDPSSGAASYLFDGKVALPSLSSASASASASSFGSISASASASASGMARVRRGHAQLARRRLERRGGSVEQTCIETNFHDLSWQGGNGADAKESALGPQSYDQHPYLSFGGYERSIDGYLRSVCNMNRPKTAADAGNGKLILGEWWIATNFDATRDDMRRFGDAQKLRFRDGQGWFYWSFKITSGRVLGNEDAGLPRDYVRAVEAGLLTRDPSKLFDEHVCDDY